MLKVARSLVSLAAFAMACSDSPSAVSGRAIAPTSSSLDKGGQSAATGISDIVNALNAAWVAKDAAAYAAPFAEDAQIITPMGTILSGRAALQARHAFLFSGPLAATTQIVAATRVQFLTGTIAMVDGTSVITGGPSVTRSLVRWVMEKRDGSWQIVGQQSTLIP